MILDMLDISRYATYTFYVSVSQPIGGRSDVSGHKDNSKYKSLMIFIIKTCLKNIYV